MNEKALKAVAKDSQTNLEKKDDTSVLADTEDAIVNVASEKKKIQCLFNYEDSDVIIKWSSKQFFFASFFETIGGHCG